MQNHQTDIPTRRLALLIDCDNISPKSAENILDKAKQYGRLTFKRAYGDLFSNRLQNWLEVCRKFAIRPVHQFTNAGKNSTDIALVIDAMEILYMYAHHNVDGFCICSSDRDYVPLVMRLRESGLFVIGFGNKQISSPDMPNAYDKFIYLEDTPDSKPSASGTPKLDIDEDTKNNLIEAYEAALVSSANSEGVPLNKLGPQLKSRGVTYKGQLNKYLSKSQLFRTEGEGSQMRAFLK